LCHGVQEEINESCYAGEYSSVIVGIGTTYVFSSSIATDFITITEDDGTTVLAFGTGDVFYNADFTGEVYFFTHTDNACGESEDLRSRIVTCTAGGGTGCTTYFYGGWPSETWANSAMSIEEEIAPDCKAGQFSRVEVVDGSSYTFRSSVATDFLTITNEDESEIVAYGTGTVTYLADYTGIVFFYSHTDADCGESADLRSRYSTRIGTGCTNSTYGVYPTALWSNSSCDGNTVETIAADCKAGQYSRVNLETGKTYTFASSNLTDFITLTNNTGTVIYNSGVTPVMFEAVANEEVRFYTHTNESCDEENVNRSRKVTCFPAACTSGFLWPTDVFTPSCTGTIELIASDAFAGEYTVVVLQSGVSYQFTSSIATDFVTITDEQGDVVFASGNQGLVFIPELSGNYRYFLNTNAECGTEAIDRNRMIQCGGSTGIEEVSEYSLNIYPNPATTQFTISADAEIEEIQILSIDGKLLLTTTPTSLSTTLSLENFQSGTYFVRATIRGGIVTKEVIKQ
jgi:ribosomal protein S11